MITEVTDSSFDKEVIKSTKPVILKFEADWCVDPESTWIITENNFPKQAKTISNTDSLLTYDGQRIVSDNVIKSFTSNMLGHCKQIITETDRQIKVTDEHEFLTPKGWKKAEDLKYMDKVAIFPMYYTVQQEINNDKILISEKQIKKIAKNPMLVDKYVEELKLLNLIPLKLNNKNLHIIARLMGMLFSDGNLYENPANNYREITFFTGTEKDTELIKTDLKNIGIKKIYIKNRQNKLVGKNNRVFYITTDKIKICSTSFWLFFKGLGVPIGDKTKTKYFIPKWLMKAPKPIKREFLAAYLGGDGPKISIGINKEKTRPNRKPSNSLQINDIEFHKSPSGKKSGLKFASQIVKLLNEFEVKTKKIFSEKDDYLKKDGTKSEIIHIPFNHNFENGYNLYKNIGYRYALSKELESSQSAEFLRRIIHKKKERKSMKLKSFELYGQDKLTFNGIAKRLNISPSIVRSWIVKDTKVVTPHHQIKYIEWLKENTKGLNDGLMWEPIEKINNIYLESVQKIRMENNHNFIANGFLAHNCGPCQAMKPVFEELSKDMDDVKFYSVNVDENPKIANQFGVRSIPMFVVLNKGQPVGAFVGAMSKTELKNKIKGFL